MSDDTKACPVCGETIKAAAVKCRFCNTDLTAFVAAKEAESERTLFLGHPEVIYSAWQWLAVIVTLGIAYLVYWFRSISTTYHITTQRIRIERGLLSKVEGQLGAVSHRPLRPVQAFGHEACRPVHGPPPIL